MRDAFIGRIREYLACFSVRACVQKVRHWMIVRRVRVEMEFWIARAVSFSKYASGGPAEAGRLHVHERDASRKSRRERENIICMQPKVSIAYKMQTLYYV